MSSDLPPLKSWQFFKAIAKVLGRSQCHAIFNCSEREFYRWGADPDSCGDIRKNPLDLIAAACRKADLIGHTDIAVAPAHILAEPFNCRVSMAPDVTPNRPTIEAECLDDHPAMVAFHEGIRRGLPLEEVGALRDRAVHEIEETFVKYREGQG
jgi:hypothetical protein